MNEQQDNPLNAELRERLRQYQVPKAGAGFFANAVQAALDERARRSAQPGQPPKRSARRLAGMIGGAVAAGVLAWLVLPVFTGVPGTLPRSAAPDVVNIALARPETIHLLFSTSEALEDAKLTVVLPPGVELAGFPGQREISWHTSLAEGRNLLPLELLALAPEGGELLAYLEHGTRDKAFRLQLKIG
jgi:hypothetical protein